MLSMCRNIFSNFVCIVLKLMLILGSANSAYAWPWSRDMFVTPVVKNERTTGAEPIGVPQGGLNPVVPAREKFQNPILVKNSLAGLRNPVRPTGESLKNGEKLYKIYCQPCHGVEGKGDGEVAKRMVPPQDLTSDYAKSKTDGYLFATIAGGGLIMPAQKKALSDNEIWDIVNFIRKLQGFDVMKKWEEENKGGN